MPFQRSSLIRRLIAHLENCIDYYSVIAPSFCLLCLLVGYYSRQTYYNQENEHQPIPLVISSMKSLDFKYILVSEISISSLLILSAVVGSLSDSRTTILASKGALINLSILTSLLLASLFNFLVAVPNQDYLLMYTLLAGRLVFISASICSYAYRYGKSIWRSRIVLVLVISLCIGYVLKVVLMTRTDAKSSIAGPIGIIATIFQLFGTSMITIYLLRWFWILYEKSKTSRVTDDEISTTIYMSLEVVTLITLWIFGLVFNLPSVRQYTVTFLCFIEIMLLLFAVVQSMFQIHVVRRESSQQKEELEFKRMFVRYISHEVRTPLNTAIMGLQVLYEELENSTTSNENCNDSLDTLRDCKASCDVAVNVLNELLTFDKLEAGTLMVEKTQFNALEQIEETVHLFQIQARKAGVHLTVTLCHDNERCVRIAELNADRNKISQIMRNLISNGLKFTPPGGTVDVLVSVVDETAENGRACKILKLDVMDSGTGISMENQKRLFKEIVQFNPGKLQNGGGSGLGLYISYGIAKLHGGRLSVYSKGEGHGCTFSCILPCTLNESSMFVSLNLSMNMNMSKLLPAWDAASNKGHGNGNDRDSNGNDRDNNNGQLSPIFNLSLDSLGSDERYGSCNSLQFGVSPVDLFDANNVRCDKSVSSSPVVVSHNLHILVVDDSAMSRKMQCRLLRKRCVSCIEAENGQEAVDKVEMAMTGGGDGINPIDLVIMDCNMPVMNGMDAAKTMRDMGYTGIVIGVTGNVSTDDIDSFIAHGANVVLAKPLDIMKFDIAVNKLVKSRFS